MVANFERGVTGDPVYLNRMHDDMAAGVGGEFRRIWRDGDRLMGELEWREPGIRWFRDDGFKFFSIEFNDHTDKETGEAYGPALYGVALLPRPFIKRMVPTNGPGRLHLSDDGLTAWAIADDLELSDQEQPAMNEFLKKLKAALAAHKLHESVVKQLTDAATETFKTLGEDKAKIDAVVGIFDPVAKALGAAGGDKPMTVNLGDFAKQVQIGGPEVSDEQIAKFLGGEAGAKFLSGHFERWQADQHKAAAAAKSSLAAKRKLFTDELAAHKGLTENTRTLLGEQFAELIVADTPDAQVQTIIDKAKALGDTIERERQLSQIGFNSAMQGQVGRVEPGSTSIGEQAGGLLREKLLLTDEYDRGRLFCPEESKLNIFGKKVLGAFDAMHAHKLDAERKMLAADGSVNVADGDFPVVAKRQVILELLASNAWKSIISMRVDTSAQATVQIPYEQRNTSTIAPGAVTYEGQPIRPACVKQLMDQAYVLPRKIAMQLSREIIHFSRVSQINWDAWARNIASNARLMNDVMAAAMANEMLRSADAFNAGTVSGESIAAQLDGSTSTIKTVQFPVVRPYTARDLQGTAIGSTQNPITIDFNGTPVTEYDGTGEQAAGTYFRVADVNLGYIQFVDETGAAVTPNEATATIDYSYSTNVVKFDLDIPNDVDADQHYNGLLNTVGRRKAYLRNNPNFVRAAFTLSSPVLNQTVTEARGYNADVRKEGEGLNAEGDLQRLQGLPSFGIDTPGNDFGDNRILLGEVGTLDYAVNKPFSTEPPFEVMREVNGEIRPTGEWQAYGIEFSSIHVPAPIRNRLTSVLAYSASSR